VLNWINQGRLDEEEEEENSHPHNMRNENETLKHRMNSKND
jgi:hypothetical protein